MVFFLLRLLFVVFGDWGLSFSLFVSSFDGGSGAGGTGVGIVLVDVRTFLRAEGRGVSSFGSGFRDGEGGVGARCEEVRAFFNAERSGGSSFRFDSC